VAARAARRARACRIDSGTPSSVEQPEVSRIVPVSLAFAIAMRKVQYCGLRMSIHLSETASTAAQKPASQPPFATSGNARHHDSRSGFHPFEEPKRLGVQVTPTPPSRCFESRLAIVESEYGKTHPMTAYDLDGLI